MTNEKNTERVVALLSKDTVEKLTAEAKSKGLSVSGLIRMVILEYFEKAKEKENG